MTVSRNYDLIKANGGHGSVYEAVHQPTGIRSKFECVEHINVGQAWMMRDTEGKVANPILDDSLTDLAVVTPNHRNTVVSCAPVEYRWDNKE